MSNPLSALHLTCVLLGFAALAAATQVVNVYGVACHVQIIGIDYPDTIQPNQSLQVTTRLMVTCVPINDNVVARVDLVAVDTNKTIASNSYGIGTIQVATGQYKVVNVSIANTIRSPSTIGTLKLQVVAWVFAGPYVQATVNQPIQVQIGTPIQLTTASTTEIVQSQTSQTITPTYAGPTSFGIIALVIALAFIVSVAVFFKRKRPHSQVASEVVRHEDKHADVNWAEAKAVSGDILPTGYVALDNLLGGGLPAGRAILVVSPPWDERDLLFNKIIESALALGNSVFFLSRDLGRSQDLATKYAKNFYVLTTQADKIAGYSDKVFKISNVLNLNDVNISFSRAIDAIPVVSGIKIIIIDFLSDVLLEHKALTTRKWLDDFIARRKSEGFTVLATLNPLISSEQESQTVIDLFDGIINVYEKERLDRSRRFLLVKKMYGRKYIDTELMLDKDKLFQAYDST
jgi:KaiC/GvpD/RAD55 family RecA-like ATPase